MTTSTHRSSAARGRAGGLALLAALAACSGSSSSGSSTPTEKPQAGGDLTIETASSLAYDTPSPGVASDAALLERFRDGDRLYGLRRVASPAVVPGTGGLGPLFAGRACTDCHQGAGRTLSTLFTHGGTGPEFSGFLTFLRSRATGTYYPEYGRVLHDHALLGVQPEGRVNVTYTESCDTFPTEEHEAYCLQTPHYAVTDWYAGAPAADDLVMSVRTPLRHVGMGLMLSVDRSELIALADKGYPEYGVHGKVQWITETGVGVSTVPQVGVSGTKAQHGDLTVELGFSSDLGVNNPRYPDSVAKGQVQELAGEGIEITTAEMANVDFYMRTLGVPARRDVDDPTVKRGEALFEQATCTACHQPTMHTSASPPALLDGTAMPMLASQTFHPYSDYLVHDMGPYLADEYSQFVANGGDWRTAPLWAIGLQAQVNGHTHLLHDMRARNFVEAIMWHGGGEAKHAYELFRNMPKADRDALVRFLESL